jgi:hypothetical protein
MLLMTDVAVRVTVAERLTLLTTFSILIASANIGRQVLLMSASV